MRANSIVSDAIPLVVVGAHMTGMPLNHELEAFAADFIGVGRTKPLYRLYELAGKSPAKPGLIRVGEGEGTAIEVEIWSLAPAAFGTFVSRIPPPLGIGTIELEGREPAKGFLVEAVAIRDARDISTYGGWRNYQLSLRSVA